MTKHILVFLTLLSTVAGGSVQAEPHRVALGFVAQGSMVPFQVGAADFPAPAEGSPKLAAECDCTVVTATQGGGFEGVFAPVKPGDYIVPIKAGQETVALLEAVVLSVGEKAGEVSWITLDEVQRLKAEKQPVVIVDVRPASQREIFPLRNLERSELRGIAVRRDWRDKHIIVVGNSLVDPGTVLQLEQLKAKGFRKLSILRGGARAWSSQTQSGPLPEVTFRVPSYEVKAADFINSLPYKEWQIVRAGAPGVGEDEVLNGFAVRHLADSSAWASLLEELEPGKPVLFLTGDGVGHRELEARLPTGLDAWYVAGGAREISQYFEFRVRMAHAQPVKIQVSSADASLGNPIAGRSCVPCQN